VSSAYARHACDGFLISNLNFALGGYIFHTMKGTSDLDLSDDEGVEPTPEPEPNFSANGTMTNEQMRHYLQRYHGIPIALREQGTTDVTCPFCHKVHFALGAGHHAAECEPNEWYPITINGKSYVTGYGFTIYEYYDTPDFRRLVVAPNLDQPTEVPTATPIPSPTQTLPRASPPIWTEMQRAFNKL
jgi:hypothetical protein